MSRLILGIQCVREALRASGSAVERVLIEQGDSATLGALERYAMAQGVRVERAPRALLDKLSAGTRHQGAAAYAPPLRILGFEQALLPAPALLVALDEVQDPQNFGAVVRSAVAIAGATVMFSEHAAAPLTPATFRASAGAIEHARLLRVSSLRSALGACAADGALVVALDGGSDTALYDLDLTGPVVLVIGSEGYGIGKGVRAVATAVAHLPMSGLVGSMNASAAAAVALYECVRQRKTKQIGALPSRG